MPPPSAAVRFAFVKLMARDLPRLTAFYEAGLGLSPVRTIETPALVETILAGAADDPFRLVLWRPRSGAAPEPGPGQGPLGFHVDDVDAALARAEAAGATRQGDPFDVPSLRVVFLRDPEGHELEFIAPRA